MCRISPNHHLNAIGGPCRDLSIIRNRELFEKSWSAPPIRPAGSGSRSGRSPSAIPGLDGAQPRRAVRADSPSDRSTMSRHVARKGTAAGRRDAATPRRARAAWLERAPAPERGHQARGDLRVLRIEAEHAVGHERVAGAIGAVELVLIACANAPISERTRLGLADENALWVVSPRTRSSVPASGIAACRIRPLVDHQRDRLGIACRIFERLLALGRLLQR